MFELQGVDARELTEEQRCLVMNGKCPFCEHRIASWKPALGGLAPEWWATCRERGIDPATGHAARCPRKQIALR